MLTSREVQALNAILEMAIVKSVEEDDGDPVFHEVNVKDVNPFDNESIQDEVYTGLAKEGFIQCSGTDDLEGGEVLDYVCITQEGYEELKLNHGVH